MGQIVVHHLSRNLNVAILGLLLDVAQFLVRLYETTFNKNNCRNI